MRYGKIVAFKIESNNLSDLKAFISGLKGYANGNAISTRINIAYVTEEPCVNKEE